MINSTILVGRLARDPELRKTGTGKSVLNFTVVCDRKFSKTDEVDYINCVAWNQTADYISSYLKKGALVGLEGRIQTGSYEDRETGKTIYTTDVVVDTLQAMESKAQAELRESQSSSYSNQPRQQSRENTYQDRAPKFAADPEPSTPMDEEPVLDITSDDLPF